MKRKPVRMARLSRIREAGREFDRALNAFRVRYLIVGAHAVMYYAEPRFTRDLDVGLLRADKKRTR
jgi:hypothetical protein